MPFRPGIPRPVLALLAEKISGRSLSFVAPFLSTIPTIPLDAALRQALRLSVPKTPRRMIRWATAHRKVPSGRTDRRGSASTRPVDGADQDDDDDEPTSASISLQERRDHDAKTKSATDWGRLVRRTPRHPSLWHPTPARHHAHRHRRRQGTDAHKAAPSFFPVSLPRRPKPPRHRRPQGTCNLNLTSSTARETHLPPAPSFAVLQYPVLDHKPARHQRPQGTSTFNPREKTFFHQRRPPPCSNTLYSTASPHGTDAHKALQPAQETLLPPAPSSAVLQYPVREYTPTRHMAPKTIETLPRNHFLALQTIYP
ncbi:hypothetical protein DFH07DRAFT_1028781 [Mycena maculata]|uniref:Uncharacterized protein n=1 Tax=Mycena maculata TaxID=230809 RepID=A0AAD7J5K9_9AGAR|nr:hypothetical protein DFH07DRAFT_1028781 [Mycena maculata]